MTDVFISYARSTGPTAKLVADALRLTGHEVWMDEQLLAHRPYADEIAEQLESAKAVIAIWSRAATQSHWVRSEADRARIKGTLVQVSVDDAPLPMPFDQIQCIDLRAWSGDISAAPWQRVLGSVAQLLGLEVDIAPAGTSAPDGSPQPSVAVFSFRDLSESRDQGYFCEGIAEEIINALTRLPGLRVAASAMERDEAADDGLAIARALDVSAVLQGSVRKSGDRARVGVRLVETTGGFTMWAESFDRSLTDIFQVQEEIARAIVAALGVRLLARDSAGLTVGGTSNAKAYDLYLRARQLVRKELESEGRTAAELFRQAAREDPQFALAFAGLADALVPIARWRLPGWEEAEQEALTAAEQAIALAPTLAEAHLAHGAALRLRHDPGARAAYQLALELSPENPHVHYRFARFLVLEGEKAEAIAHYERAFALAPDDYRYIVFALQEYQALGDAAGERSCLERASAAIERHLAVNPEDARAFGHGAGVLALLGKSDEANRFIARALAFRPDDYGNLVTLACAASLNRDPDQALDLLERAISTGRGDREWLVTDNDLKPLQGHPRFDALLQRMK